ncbi:unnamed protein product [Mycena citricolor]|uniref:Uncharacterized protein n=1 Tax=Mycena citricolor TaxID=2018698 RepID=A0AAD2H3C6_9AGAR|nr:unnamed protein product [Mycena citricolor]
MSSRRRSLTHVDMCVRAAVHSISKDVQSKSPGTGTGTTLPTMESLCRFGLQIKIVHRIIDPAPTEYLTAGPYRHEQNALQLPVQEEPMRRPQQRAVLASGTRRPGRIRRGRRCRWGRRGPRQCLVDIVIVELKQLSVVCGVRLVACSVVFVSVYISVGIGCQVGHIGIDLAVGDADDVVEKPVKRGMGSRYHRRGCKGTAEERA